MSRSQSKVPFTTADRTPTESPSDGYIFHTKLSNQSFSGIGSVPNIADASKKVLPLKRGGSLRHFWRKEVTNGRDKSKRGGSLRHFWRKDLKTRNSRDANEAHFYDDNDDGDTNSKPISLADKSLDFSNDDFRLGTLELFCQNSTTLTTTMTTTATMTTGASTSGSLSDEDNSSDSYEKYFARPRWKLIESMEANKVAVVSKVAVASKDAEVSKVAVARKVPVASKDVVARKVTVGSKVVVASRVAVDNKWQGKTSESKPDNNANPPGHWNTRCQSSEADASDEENDSELPFTISDYSWKRERNNWNEKTVWSEKIGIRGRRNSPAKRRHKGLGSERQNLSYKY